MARQWQPWGSSHPVRVALKAGTFWLDAWASVAETSDAVIVNETGMAATRLAVIRAGAKVSINEVAALAQLWNAPAEDLWASTRMPSGKTKDYPTPPPTPSRPPTPARLTQLALWTLENAFAESRVLRIERNNDHRLALGWLVHAGIAQEYEVRAFWRSIAPYDTEEYGINHDPNCVHTITSSLNWWHGQAGLPVPDKEERLRRIANASQRVDLSALADQFWRMCNRYRQGEREVITKVFGARQLAPINDGPSIVHPRDPGLVIRWEDGGAVIEQMTWGFPVVLKGKQGQPLKPKPVNNARFDKLNGFWRRWANARYHRCLIPTSSFAEAEGDYGSMTTTWLSLKDEPVFAWAGLWTNSEQWGAVYTGVMTDAALGLEDIHDRCPVILRPSEWDTWLTAPLADLKQFDRALPADRFEIDRTNIPWAKGGQPRLI